MSLLRAFLKLAAPASEMKEACLISNRQFADAEEEFVSLFTQFSLAETVFQLFWKILTNAFMPCYIMQCRKH